MGKLDSRLMQEIIDLSDTEVQSAQILFALFNRELEELYKSKISLIEENINSQIEYFGKDVGECSEQKENIIKKYNDEFQKIYDERRSQFCSIEIEIQEIQANEKIAIANFKKIVEDKNNFLKSNKYSEYINKKKQFENIVDTTLNHEEFDKYTNLLENLTDPIEAYNKKLEALVNKYNGYKELIEECEKKLYECIDASKKEFEEIVKYRSASLAVKKKENIILKFINNLLNKINKNSKFEKEVIQKMESELQEVEKTNNVIVDTINNQTVTLIAKIEEVRESLTNEFKLAIQ